MILLLRGISLFDYLNSILLSLKELLVINSQVSKSLFVLENNARNAHLILQSLNQVFGVEQRRCSDARLPPVLNKDLSFTKEFLDSLYRSLLRYEDMTGEVCYFRSWWGHNSYVFN